MKTLGLILAVCVICASSAAAEPDEKKPAPDQKKPVHAEGPAAPETDFAKVELQGTLEVYGKGEQIRQVRIRVPSAFPDVIAGGFDLTFPDEKELRKATQGLEDKTVIVTGYLIIRSRNDRVPVKQPFVVRVTSLKEAGAK